jgi:LPXTG-site transpeptidase (sortase) family protein
VKNLRNIHITHPFFRLWMLIPIALTIALIAIPLLVAADAALSNRSTFNGNLSIVASGVGLSHQDSGDIHLDIPGTPIHAFLYWAGFDVDERGDDTVILRVNGGPPVTLTADIVYGPDYSAGTDLDNYPYVYRADVSSLVLPGLNTYSISGFGPIVIELGAGLLVVYEDPDLPNSHVEIVDGQDYAYFPQSPPRGPNTEVSCVQFEASINNRLMDFTIFVGGIDISGELRPNALWYQTGEGPLPVELVNQPGATEIGGQPFNSLNGAEWDTYKNSINIPSGATYACFQIESVSDMLPLWGASLLWLALGVDLPVDVSPTPSETTTATPTESSTPTATSSPTSIASTTPTNTFTPSPTNTSTNTSTPTPSNTPTSTPTNTSTDTPTVTPSYTASSTPPPTPTDTPTGTPSSTSTATPSSTATMAPSPTPSNTRTPDPTRTAVPVPTSTPTQSFNGLIIPVTGFSPDRMQQLPDQPSDLRYTSYHQIWLEIENLELELPIIGIPLDENGWDVRWLTHQIGYLEGTAFPTWSGNTVLTSHVCLSDGSPGPFAHLGDLQWGDLITIHAFGLQYNYEVRRWRYVHPDDLSVFSHEQLDWVTLITCTGYDAYQDTYRGRLAIQAVLMQIEPE